VFEVNKTNGADRSALAMKKLKDFNVINFEEIDMLFNLKHPHIV
jgi:hypothetical protein